ncbi:MAG TPA: metallopeptidase TldD-related protein [Lachnospiraceae bacterium]|nr:metallopeptidase TldD-related protein [Lachnospiraceae bacterium]
MLDRILTILKQNSISTYLINEKIEESVELFFIRKRLDMRRQKNVHHYIVTVYHEFKKDDKRMLGSSTASIFNGMTDTEITEAIKSSYYAASFVCNPYFEIPSGSKEDYVQMESSLSSHSLSDNALLIADALFTEDTREDVFLNSSELFVTKTNYHIVNSKGIDVSYQKYCFNGEFVAQCTSPQDVEMHQTFNYDNLDTDALKDKVRRTLEMTQARANATTAPSSGDYTVILSDHHVSEVLSYYLDRSAASLIYPKYSNYEIGCNVQGDGVTGELLNVTLKAKDPYSSEGIRMIDRPLLEEGKLQTIHGGSRFAYYLGIEPTGDYRSITVPSGTLSFEEMKSGKYLYVVNFSDFQMDTLSGHFAGEIRLAFLSDGHTVTPVTGGSINGNLLEAQKNITFSKELQMEEDFVGPFAVRFENISVAGA